jgi:hypothetical protein
LPTLSGSNSKLSEQVATTATQAEGFSDAVNYQTTELPFIQDTEDRTQGSASPVVRTTGTWSTLKSD